MRRWLRSSSVRGDAGFRVEDAMAGLSGDGGLVERGGLVDAFKVEAGDLLRLAVLEDGEVFGGESADDFAGLLVTHDDVGEDEIAVDLKREGGLVGVLVGRLLGVRADDNGEPESGCEAESLETVGHLRVSLIAEASREGELAHGGGGDDFAVGCRAERRVDP